MTSRILEIFKQAIEIAEQQEGEYQEADQDEGPGVEAICSDEKEPVGDEIVNASIVYSILNGDKDSPNFSFTIEDFTSDSLESLAKLIAPMAHPKFFYLVVSKIQNDFMNAGREMDFSYFMKQLDTYKSEFESNMGDPHISPLRLSRGGNND